LNKRIKVGFRIESRFCFTLKFTKRRRKNIGYYNRNYTWLYPRDKHATISVLTFRQQDLSAQDNYLIEAQAEHMVRWLKRKTGTFQTEITETIKKLNAQFHPRGHNKVLECLQFGGNLVFWQDFPDEQEIEMYFRHCYDFAVNYIGFMQTDKNIICALTVTEPNRQNLFLYYLPVTDKWKIKAMGNEKSENGNKLQMRDESGNPIYKTRRFITKPLLCHSEFWKQRGEEMSYSVLQECFYQSISKRYGAKRGKVRRCSNTPLPNKQSGLSVAPTTSMTFSKSRKEFGCNLLTTM
jgi:hypothetical protein